MNPTIPPPGRLTRWLTHSRARTILTITIAVILSMIGATLAISIAIHDTQTATTPGQDTTTGTATFTVQLSVILCDKESVVS